MYGINTIASYIPNKRASNYLLKNKFEIDDSFIKEKIGVEGVARKEDNETITDLCLKAFDKLCLKNNFIKENIEVIVVITQNPDQNIPHTSAVLHDKLGLKENCAAFDISLGCSGYPYGLSIISSFMEKNNINNGLLFTCDPYSKIINDNDKNTRLLFGDAASVTLITNNPNYIFGKFNFGTIGSKGSALVCNDKILSMNGREIFNFAAQYIPKDTLNVLVKNSLKVNEIDFFVFHQGSKYIIDTLIRRLNLDSSKVVYDISNYGNTVSSSIPIILEKLFKKEDIKKVLISGFGVGLSWSSTILIKNEVNGYD